VPGATEDFYRNIFASNKLTDIFQTSWSLLGVMADLGPNAIARRLDRFLVAEDLHFSNDLPVTWVEHPYISDHAPIFLQLRTTVRFAQLPFKFNQDWLLEADYNDLVAAVWRDPCFLTESMHSADSMETESLEGLHQVVVS
jgi:hypothetical protein